MRLGLEELKDSLVWFELARQVRAGKRERVDQAIAETDRPIRIFVASIATARRNDR